VRGILRNGIVEGERVDLLVRRVDILGWGLI
jgi:hypothetical protein